MNLLEQMLGLLTSAYARKDVRNARKGLPLETEIGRLFSILCWGLSLVEDTTGRIREWDDIEHARGAVLDRHGANYGVERGGADDPFYRLMIKVKMMAQLSGGDIDTVIHAVAVLYDLAPEHVELEEYFPAKIRVFVDNGYVTEEKREYAALISRLTKRIVAAGVGFDILLKIPHQSDPVVYVAGASLRRTPHESLIPAPQPRRSNPKIYMAAAVMTCVRRQSGGVTMYG